MERTGIHHVTDQTVRRLLNRNGYFFLQARKKGLMSQTDKDRRVEFARKMHGCKGLSRLRLQEGDPSQNSKAAQEAMARCHSEL